MTGKLQDLIANFACPAVNPAFKGPDLLDPDTVCFCPGQKGRSRNLEVMVATKSASNQLGDFSVRIKIYILTHQEPHLTCVALNLLAQIVKGFGVSLHGGLFVELPAIPIYFPGLIKDVIFASIV